MDICNYHIHVVVCIYIYSVQLHWEYGAIRLVMAEAETGGDAEAQPVGWRCS